MTSKLADMHIMYHMVNKIKDDVTVETTAFFDSVHRASVPIKIQSQLRMSRKEMVCHDILHI